VTLGHDMDRTWPQIDVPFPDGVVMAPAVQYSVPPSSRPLCLDVYRRTKADGADPVIIFVHGGSWARGDSRASRPLRRFPWVLASIAARGFVVASIEYRMVGEALWPAQGQDVNSAVRFLRKNAAQFGAAADRIAVWGVSCGGHLAGIAATTAHVAELASHDPALAETDGAVQAAAAWYGGFNMETLTAQCEAQPGCHLRDDARSPEWTLLGGLPDTVGTARLQSASPVHYASARSAPMLIITGDDDVLIPAAQSIEMAAALNAAGGSAELVVLPGVGHDFAGATAEETRAANSRAMELTLAFFDQRLKPA
jgi:acetyl esterase/lipase